MSTQSRTDKRDLRRKPRKPITCASDLSALPITLDFIGRAPKYRPYITVNGFGVHSYVNDQDVRRLRDWCNEILGVRK